MVSLGCVFCLESCFSEVREVSLLDFCFSSNLSIEFIALGGIGERIDLNFCLVKLAFVGDLGVFCIGFSEWGVEIFISLYFCYEICDSGFLTCSVLFIYFAFISDMNFGQSSGPSCNIFSIRVLYFSGWLVFFECDCRTTLAELFSHISLHNFPGLWESDISFYSIISFFQK